MDAQVLGEIVGQVLGQVLGMQGADHVGYDVDGARALARPAGRGALARLPASPAWRQPGHDLPAGVQLPNEGLEPLPLTPQVNAGVFTSLVTNINFEAKPQRPFRGQRLLAQVFRNGPSAGPLAAVTSGVFIGTRLQQLQIGDYNVEFFTPTAFGVGMVMEPAQAGIDVTVPIRLSGGVLTAPDTLAVQIVLMGSSIR